MTPASAPTDHLSEEELQLPPQGPATHYLIASEAFLIPFGRALDNIPPDENCRAPIPTENVLWIVPYLPGVGSLEPPERIEVFELANRCAHFLSIAAGDHVALTAALNLPRCPSKAILPAETPDVAANIARLLAPPDKVLDSDNPGEAAKNLAACAAALLLSSPPAGALGQALIAAASLMNALAYPAKDERGRTLTTMAALALGLSREGPTGGGILGEMKPTDHAAFLAVPGGAALMTAVLCRLSDRAQCDTDDCEEACVTAEQKITAVAAVAAAEREDKSEPSNLRRTIILDAVPPAVEPAESAEVKRFSPLAKPIDLTPMPDVAEFYGALMEEFPWMERSNIELAESLALRALAPDAPFIMAPLLLVGTPGVGKTRYARRVAALAATPFRSFDASDAQAVVNLSGLPRGWRGARPGYALQAIRQAKVANPLILVDEIGQTPSSKEFGSVKSVLMGYLAPETAERFEDAFLQTPCDLSAVNWIMTANEVGELSEALLDRTLRLDVPPIPTYVFPNLLKKIHTELAAEMRIPLKAMPEFSGEVVDELYRLFAAGCSPRNLRDMARTVLGAATFRMRAPLVALANGMKAGMISKAKQPMGFDLHAAAQTRIPEQHAFNP